VDNKLRLDDDPPTELISGEDVGSKCIAEHRFLAGDRGSARRLLETASGLVGRIAGLPQCASAMVRISTAVALLAPSWSQRLLDQAKAVAYTIEGEGLFGYKEDDQALKEIVLDVAVRSRREVRQILGLHSDALTTLACEVFPEDPDRAERLVLGISHIEHRISTFVVSAGRGRDDEGLI
jgi:hypothetical protein